MERTLKSELIFNGKVVKLYKDEVELEDGKVAFREVIRHNGGVGVLAIIDDEILLVKQYRYPNACDTLEIPAGKLEVEEKPMECAFREVEEETGYRAKEMHQILKFLPTPGYSSEWIYIYEASSLEKVENPLPMDEDENIEVIKLKIDDAYQATLDGSIVDAKTILAIHHAYMKKHI